MLDSQLQTLNHSDLRTTPFWGRTERGHLQQYGPPLEETYSMFLVQLKVRFQVKFRKWVNCLEGVFSTGLTVGAEEYDFQRLELTN